MLSQPQVKALLSEKHCTVGGTLIEAFAGLKSFRPKADPGAEPPAGGGRNAERDFHGERRSNATHASTTHPEARLLRKGPGKEAKLCFMRHLLMENRHGLIVEALLSEASGTAERDAALTMIGRTAGRHRATPGADKAYDVASSVTDLRALKVTPHVAQNTTNRRSAIDRRTTRHAGYAISQRLRPRLEESVGWIRTVDGLHKTRHRGNARVGRLFTLTATACNLIRLPKLAGDRLTMPGVLPRPDSPSQPQPGSPCRALSAILKQARSAPYRPDSAPC